MLTSTRMENNCDLVFLAMVTSADAAVVVVAVVVAVELVVVAVEGAARMNVAVDNDAEAHCVVQSKVAENNLDVEALRTKRPFPKHLHDTTLL